MIQTTLWGLPGAGDGDDKHRCTQCRKGFASATALSSHVRHMHKEAPPPLPPPPLPPPPPPQGRSLQRLDSLEGNRARLGGVKGVSSAAKKADRGAAVAAKKAARGADRRQRYDTSFKRKSAIEARKHLDGGLTIREVAKNMNLPFSLLSKWTHLLAAGRLDELGFEVKKTTCGSVPDRQADVEKRVVRRAEVARKKKKDVTTEDLQRWGQECCLAVAPEGLAKVKFSTKWARRFKQRHGLRKRVATNRTCLSLTEEKEALGNFLAWLRRQLRLPVPAAGFEYVGDVWGRFPPSSRYNMDEVGVVLEGTRRETLTFPAERRANCIPVKGKRPARLATAMLTANADTHVAPTALVFAGQGKLPFKQQVGLSFIANKKDCCVAFQKTGWVDIPTFAWWAKKVFIPFKQKVQWGLLGVLDTRLEREDSQGRGYGENARRQQGPRHVWPTQPYPQIPTR